MAALEQKRQAADLAKIAADVAAGRVPESQRSGGGSDAADASC